MRIAVRTVTTRRPQAAAGTGGGTGLPRPVMPLAAASVLLGLLAVAAVVVELAAPLRAGLWAASAGWLLGGLMMLTGTLAAALRQEPGAARTAWLLHSLGSVFWIAGAAIRLAMPLGTISPAAAICWLAFTVPCIAATARRLPRMSLFWASLVQAIPMVLLIVAIVRSLAVLGGHLNALEGVLATLYPALYVLLAACTIQMSVLYRGLRRVPGTVWLLALGFFAMALASLFWVPAAASNGSAQGHLTDLLWTAGLLIVGGAGLLRVLRPSGSLMVPPCRREVGTHALPPAAAIVGLIILLAVPKGDRLLVLSFLLASGLALFVRVAMMRHEDLKLLRDLGRSQAEAERAAVASRRTAGRLRLLADVTPRIKSLVLEELLQAVCDTARELVGARYSALGLGEERNEAFTHFSGSGIDDEALARTDRLPAGARVLAALFRSGGAVRLPLLSDRPVRALLPAGYPLIDNFMAIPVPLGAGQHGALYLAGKEGGFSQEDESLAQLLAANAGHAIANAQLYAESQTQQEQLTAQNERLRELDRMKDEFVALVSHELRTPLTSIVGYLELIREEDAGSLTAAQRRFTAIMHRNADRLLHLVGDLLFLGGLQSGQLPIEDKEVDLASLVGHSLDEARPEAERKGISIAHSLCQVPRVAGDPERLAQLADNVIANAIKFTQAGGHVTVAVQPEGEHAMLAVSDTGIGIPASDQPHIFERFYRSPNVTDQAIQGTGLGLTISKAIVDAHRGSISVESKPGHGATFRIRLPVQAGGSPAAPGLDDGRVQPMQPGTLPGGSQLSGLLSRTEAWSRVTVPLAS